MKKLISLSVALAICAPPALALAGPGMRGLGPVMVKKAMKDAGLSDQQVRRVELLRDESERQVLDIRHEMHKARIDLRQMMQVDSPDRAAIFGQLEKIAGIRLQLEKNRVELILDIRREVTPEQWEKLQLLRAEHRLKQRGPHPHFTKKPGKPSRQFQEPRP